MSKVWGTTIVLLALLAPGVVLAQDEERPERSRRSYRGGGWGGFGFDTDKMKEPLGLSDEQVKELKEFQADLKQKREKFFKDLRENRQEFDYRKMGKVFQDARKTYTARIKEILSEDQYEKYEKLQEEQRRNRGWGGGRNREQLQKKLRKQVVKELQLTPSEAPVVEPLLDAVLTAHKTYVLNQEERRKKLLKGIRTRKNDDELKGHLAEYRQGRDTDLAELKKKQEALIRIVTPNQESVLIAYNLIN